MNSQTELAIPCRVAAEYDTELTHESPPAGRVHERDAMPETRKKGANTVNSTTYTETKPHRVKLNSTRRRDRDLSLWTARIGPNRFDLFDHIHPLDDLTEHDVSTIKPACDHRRDEELGAVRVSARISHGEQSRLGMLQCEVLISKLFAVDRLPARAVVPREIAPLQHEVRDDSVECAASIAEPMLPGCQLTEVAGSLWHGFVKQLEHYASRWL